MDDAFARLMRGDDVLIGLAIDQADRPASPGVTDRDGWPMRRIGLKIEYQTARPKRPPYGFEGIDHALSRDASERPREQSDVEGSTG